MKRRIIFFLFCFLLSRFWFPASGYAACTSPTGAAGDLIYDADAHIPQYCNGVSWVVMAPTINLPTTNGLVGYWKLNDGSGTSALDSSGNGNTGTLSGSPTWTTAGYYNGALNFVTSTSNVAVSSSSSLPFQTSNAPFTISLWLNTNNLTGLSQNAEAIMINETYNVSGFRLAINNCQSACEFEFWSSESGGTFTALNTTPAPAINTWYLVTATYDGTTARLYVNGSLEATSTGTYVGNTKTLQIGEGGSWGKSTWSGLMDDIRIYNRALSAAEISTLYNYHISPPSTGLVGWWKFDETAGTVAADSSGNGNNSTLVNGPVFTSAGKLAGALTFNGVNEYVVSSGTVNYTATFSIAAWFKTTVGGAIAGGRCRNFITTDGNRLIAATNFCSGSWPSYAVSGHTNVIDGAWHFGVFVIDGLNLRLYVDGKLDGMATQPDTGFAGTATNYIGQTGMSWSNQYFTGTIDDVRLYNRALSADEIYGLYRTSSPVCSNPSDYEGNVMYNAGTNHVVQFCDNASWRPLGPVPGAGGSGCTNPVHPEGDMIYSDSGAGSGVMQYCDGTNWIHLGGPNLPTNGLVAYWKFDEGSGTTALDSSGSGNNGTWSGTQTGTSGYYSVGKDGPWAGAFDGSTDYVNVGNPTSLQFSGNLSMTAWIYKTDASYGNMLSKTDMANGGAYLGYGFSGGGFIFGADNQSNAPASTPQASDANQWHFLAGVLNGGVRSLYLDGMFVASSSAGTSNWPTGANLFIGSGHSNATTPAFFSKALIDDVRIYNRALSAQEIWQLYNGT